MEERTTVNRKVLGSKPSLSVKFSNFIFENYFDC